MRILTMSMIIGAALLSGCATTVIKNHNGSADGQSYWMSIETKSSPVSQIEKTTWFCHAATKFEPVCVQAKLIPCDPRKADCTIASDKLFVGELPSASSK